MYGVKRNVVVFLLLLLAYSQGLAFYAYLPDIQCFDKLDYHAGRQNWAIDIDQNGIVYFANSEGLLYNVYSEWQFSPLPSKGQITSVLALNDTVFCGGNEYGFFVKENGTLVFHHLGFVNGGKVWNIASFDGNIIYQSENTLIYFDRLKKTITSQNYSEGIWAICEWQNKLWVVLRDGQLGYLKNEVFWSVSKGENWTDREVRKLFVHNNLLYIVMFEGGVFAYDGSMVNPVSSAGSVNKSTLFTGLSYNNDTYCLGTVSDGFAMVNAGQTNVRWVNSSHGLIDNTVLSMKADELGNIWLGLDYGIAKIELQSAVTSIFNGGATYAIKEFNNQTFLATNKGLFRSNASGNFEFVDSTGGQVWMLHEFDHELYICHNRGLMRLKNNKIIQLKNLGGFIDAARFGKTDYFVFSTYKGMILMRKEGENFTLLQNLDLWGNRLLITDEEHNCIWADINDSLIYKLILNNDNKVDINKIPQIAKVFHTNAGLFFYNNKNLLQYNGTEFIPSGLSLINKISENNIRAFDASSDGTYIAYIRKNQINLQVLLPDGNVHSYNSLLQSLGQNINNGYEFINIDHDRLRFATDRGVMVFDINFHSNFKKSGQPVISSICLLNSQNGYFTFPFQSSGLRFPKGNKDIRLTFNVNKSKYDVVEFRYKLYPINDDWSDWESGINQVYYPQTKGGHYTFFLQSRINGGAEENASLSFSIDKLWYQTVWVLFPILFILFAWIFGVIVVMTRKNQNKLRRQKEHYVHQTSIRTVEMKNDQLLQYIEIISHKNEFLNKIRDGLLSMRNNDARRWANMIMEEVNNEKKEFLFHKLFSEVHQDFIARITDKYPSLTSNDVRILSFIRINLGNKEISNLMNITSRSLDTNRYRLRNKLGLDHHMDLNQFVRDF